LLVLALSACGAAIRNVPAALDPSNPEAGESAAAPRIPGVGEAAAPPAGEMPMQHDTGEKPMQHEMGDMPMPQGKPMQHEMGDMPMPQGKPMQHEMGEKPMQHEMPMDHGHHANDKAKPSTDFTCTMHPEVSSPTPGRCPKCGMKLVPRKSDGEAK
jgi:hypothetical protein